LIDQAIRLALRKRYGATQGGGKKGKSSGHTDHSARLSSPFWGADFVGFSQARGKRRAAPAARTTLASLADENESRKQFALRRAQDSAKSIAHGMTCGGKKILKSDRFLSDAATPAFSITTVRIKCYASPLT
jgi:hypothetical protein